MSELQLRNAVKREFTSFIQNWKEDGKQKYLEAARDAFNNSRRHILFCFKDLLIHSNQLANLIFNEYYKYEPVINQALTEFMAEFQKNNSPHDLRRDDDNREIYQCSFDSGLDDGLKDSVRGLKCQHLGRLIKFRGTVTRTS